MRACRWSCRACAHARAGTGRRNGKHVQLLEVHDVLDFVVASRGLDGGAEHGNETQERWRWSGLGLTAYLLGGWSGRKDLRRRRRCCTAGRRVLVGLLLRFGHHQRVRQHKEPQLLAWMGPIWHQRARKLVSDCIPSRVQWAGQGEPLLFW